MERVQNFKFGASYGKSVIEVQCSDRQYKSSKCQAQSTRDGRSFSEETRRNHHPTELPKNNGHVNFFH